jgi:two-component system chemotaxis response regulator CheY
LRRDDPYGEAIELADILIYFKDTSSCFSIEAIAKSKGYRVKTTSELPLVLEWLKVRNFSAVFVDVNCSIEEQQTIGTSLWQRRPEAPFVLYDLDKESRANRLGAVIVGADLAKGEKALETIGRILEKNLSSSGTVLKNFKIMVIDDLDSPRDIICMYLEGMGYPPPISVNSAARAIELLEADPASVGCVLTDFKMPGMNGQTLIETIRRTEKLKNLPVIVITAHGTSDCLVDCLKAGASGFLVKPFKRPELTREVARALRIYSSGESPRLVRPEDAEQVREILHARGLD